MYVKSLCRSVDHTSSLRPLVTFLLTFHSDLLRLTVLVGRNV